MLRFLTWAVRLTPLFCLFQAGIVLGQEPETLTLEECIQRAIKISPALQAAAFDRESVEAKLSQAKGAFFLPEVKLRVLGGPVPNVPFGSGPEGNFPSVDTDFTDLGPFIQARVEALQPLFTFGKLTNLKRAAEQGVLAKADQERVAKNELVRQVKRTYFVVLFLRSVLEFLDELRERATSAKERVEELIRKNSTEATEIDLMRINVFFAETERNALQTRNGINLAMSTLGILTGGLHAPPVSPAEKVLQYREVQIRDIDYYLNRARVARPELRQLDELVTAKEALMKVSQSDFFPSFFLGGFYSYAKAPGRESVDNPFLKDDFNYQTGGVGLGLEQKFSFHMTHSRYHEAYADFKKSQMDRDQATIGINLEIRKAHSDATTKQEAVKSAREGFKAGRSWVTASTLNFGVGLIPVKDLLEAFLAYSKVKIGFFDTIQDYNMALIDLARAVGEEI